MDKGGWQAETTSLPIHKKVAVSKIEKRETDMLSALSSMNQEQMKPNMERMLESLRKQEGKR